ncbi:RDD family protein [Cohnella sp. GCM10027633]|uniref:RDD family protein n=1 Tax=unclassified Cohnella TaxID=2636738 RepID=UPI003628C3F2
MECERCGRKNEDDARYCNGCGAALKGAGGSERPATYRAFSPYESGDRNDSLFMPDYAGFWRRALAVLVDGLILLLPIMLLSRILLGPDASDDNNWVEFIVMLLYKSLMESSAKQATLGKMLIGIKVTDEDGGRISFGRAAGRHLASILSGIILFIGFMMAGWTEKKQALHDLIAKTLVVKS